MAQCDVIGGLRSLRVVVGTVASSLGLVAVARRSRRRCLRRRAGAPGVGVVVSPHPRRCDVAAALPWRRLALSYRAALGGSPSLRVAVGAVASSLGAVAVAPLSRRRCLRRRVSAPGLPRPYRRKRRRGARPPLLRRGSSRSRRGVAWSAARALCAWLSARSRPLWGRSPSRHSCGAAACGAALALFVARSTVPPRSRRRDARPPLFRGGGSLSQCARCVVLGSSRSLRVALWAVAVARRSRRRCLRRRAGAPGAGLVVPPRSRRRDARPPLFRGGGSLSQCARCVVLSSSRSLRVALGAVAVARRSRRCCLRRRAGAPSSGLILPPRSRRRDARPPLFRGGDSQSWRGALCSAARPLGVWSSARSPLLWGRSPSRGARGAAACRPRWRS